MATTDKSAGKPKYPGSRLIRPAAKANASLKKNGQQFETKLKN
jgi:hypothetical protein